MAPKGEFVDDGVRYMGHGDMETREKLFKSLIELLDESKVINNAIDYILEGQAKSKQLAILTKIHTLIEMEAKVKALRSRKVEVPILFVPPHIKKSQIYLPNNGEILVVQNTRYEKGEEKNDPELSAAWARHSSLTPQQRPFWQEQT